MKNPVPPLAAALLAAALALAPLPVLAQETAAAGEAAPASSESPLSLLSGLAIGLALGGVYALIRRKRENRASPRSGPGPSPGLGQRPVHRQRRGR